MRTSESAPILRWIKRALFKFSPRYLAKGNMGKAIAYTMNQWSWLELYLLNGEVEIDNNLVENAICPTKLVMKNWLFLGSEASGTGGLVPVAAIGPLLPVGPSAGIRNDGDGPGW